MSFRRFVLPLLAAVALTATMLSAPAPSSAAGERRPTSINSGEVRNSGVFYANGRTTDWPQRYVYLQKKTCRNCNWRYLKKDLTGTGSKFNFRFGGRIGDCFRIFIRAAGGYRTVTGKVGCIVRG